MSDGAPLPGDAGDYRAWLQTQPDSAGYEQTWGDGRLSDPAAVRFDRGEAQDRLSAEPQLERFGVADRSADQQAEAQADDEHGEGQLSRATDASAEGQSRNHADSSPQGDGAGDDPAGAALDGFPELDKAVRVVRHGGSGEGSPGASTAYMRNVSKALKMVREGPWVGRAQIDAAAEIETVLWRALREPSP